MKSPSGATRRRVFLYCAVPAPDFTNQGDEDLREAVATFTSRAAEKLGRQHLSSGTVTVFILTSLTGRPTDR